VRQRLSAQAGTRGAAKADRGGDGALPQQPVRRRGRQSRAQGKRLLTAGPACVPTQVSAVPGVLRDLASTWYVRSMCLVRSHMHDMQPTMPLVHVGSQGFVVQRVYWPLPHACACRCIVGYALCSVSCALRVHAHRLKLSACGRSLWAGIGLGRCTRTPARPRRRRARCRRGRAGRRAASTTPVRAAFGARPAVCAACAAAAAVASSSGCAAPAAAWRLHDFAFAATSEACDRLLGADCTPHQSAARAPA